MTAIPYSFVVRDGAAGGARVAGLTPGFVFFKKLSDNSEVTPPTIAEIGQGAYKFTYDPASGGEAVWQVDAGSSLSLASDRYIDGTATFALQLQPADISAAAGGVLDAALSGHATAGSVGAALGLLVNTLAESYAANGQPGTLAQLLYGMLAVLTNIDQSGTTLTARKLDGTTSAMSFTLDSATAPSSRRRAA